MSYTTRQEIKQLLAHRDIGTDTVVTNTDLDQFITICDRRIDLRLDLRGVTDGEVSATVYQEGLKEIERLMVAGMAESKFKADTGEEESKEGENPYYVEGVKLLDELLDNIKMNVIPDMATDLGSSEVAPAFERTADQW